MKKSSLVLGLALTLGTSTLTFADSWDYSRLHPRASHQGDSSQSMSSDTSNQSTKTAMAKTSESIGNMTVVQAEKGGSSHTTTVTVTR